MLLALLLLLQFISGNVSFCKELPLVYKNRQSVTTTLLEWLMVIKYKVYMYVYIVYAVQCIVQPIYRSWRGETRTEQKTNNYSANYKTVTWNWNNEQNIEINKIYLLNLNVKCIHVVVRSSSSGRRSFVSSLLLFLHPSIFNISFLAVS